MVRSPISVLAETHEDRVPVEMHLRVAADLLGGVNDEANLVFVGAHAQPRSERADDRKIGPIEAVADAGDVNDEAARVIEPEGLVGRGGAIHP